MVSRQSMIFMGISAGICFLIPLFTIIYFRRKEKISLTAVAVGVLVFMIFQMSSRIPLINYLNTNPLFVDLIKSNRIAYVSFLAITAGVFEEVGKYIGFKYALKNKLQWKNGIALGIGHGGIEAILLVGTAMVNNILFSLVINLGSYDLVLKKMPEAQALTLKSTLIDTPSYMFLLGGIERLFVIVFQIALSIIVLEGVIKKNNKYLINAILIHTLVDYIAAFNPSIFITEGIMFIVAIISLKFLYSSKEKFKNIDSTMDNECKNFE
ncbi:YhfC family intramembrane metalloprotease [Clostridium sp. JNZ J1-5]